MTVVGRSIPASLARGGRSRPFAPRGEVAAMPDAAPEPAAPEAAAPEAAAPAAAAPADDLVGEYVRAVRSGDHAPEGLVGRLDLDTALDAQLAVLQTRLAAGERLGGFKVGLT